MGRSKHKTYVDGAFESAVVESKKGAVVTCTYCTKFRMAANVTRQKEHLATCERYYAELALSPSSNQRKWQFLIEAIKKAPRHWKPPNRQKLSGVLLSQVDISVKAQVGEHINKANFLNFTVDETTDITTKRIVNMSLITEGGAFLLYTLPVPTDGGSAQWLKVWVLEQWKDLL
ncbi:hypothetical protein E4U39_004027, partial [Claviceps sp. Clav50 group G5]